MFVSYSFLFYPPRKEFAEEHRDMQTMERKKNHISLLKLCSDKHRENTSENFSGSTAVQQRDMMFFPRHTKCVDSARAHSLSLSLLLTHLWVFSFLSVHSPHPIYTCELASHTSAHRRTVVERFDTECTVYTYGKV